MLVSTQPKEEKKRIKNMLEGGSVRLKPEKRQEMEERVNILTSFIRSMLNDRDAWKKHDDRLPKGHGKARKRHATRRCRATNQPAAHCGLALLRSLCLVHATLDVSLGRA